MRKGPDSYTGIIIINIKQIMYGRLSSFCFTWLSGVFPVVIGRNKIYSKTTNLNFVTMYKLCLIILDVMWTRQNMVTIGRVMVFNATFNNISVIS